MIIKRIFLHIDQIGIVIEDREEYHMMFDLQNVPNVDRLTQMIKTRITEIDAGGHTPQPTDWGPFFETLQTALEGTEIGE